MKLFNYRYLSQEQLKRLDSYKYASIDTSPLSKYVMHPFWNFVVEFVPPSVAPNVLTLLGFMCTLTNAFILAYYDYYFIASSDDARDQYQPIPSWVWLFCAINLFLAHTLDGIDGKQARRTKATGPLGELMDHGVDSWTALFVPMYVYSFFGSMDYSFEPFRMLFVFWAVFITFYMTHWEKYNTGVLYLPWCYDLSQIFLLACSLITFLSSYRIWKSIVPVLNLPCSYVFEFILYFSVFLTSPMSIYNVYLACRSGKSKYSTIQDIIRPFYSITLLLLSSTVWAASSSSNVINLDPRLYFYTVGTIFSNVATRLIVCQMTSTKCEYNNAFTIIFSLVVVACRLLPFMASIELVLLWILAVITTLGHTHYAICVVQQMCDHLKINCLTLKKREHDFSRQHQTRESSSSLNRSPQSANFLNSNHDQDTPERSVEEEQLLG